MIGKEEKVRFGLIKEGEELERKIGEVWVCGRKKENN